VVSVAATVATAANFAATTEDPAACQRSDRGRGDVKAEEMEGSLDGRRRKRVEGFAGEAIAVADPSSSSQQEENPKSPAGMRAVTHDDESLSGLRRSSPGAAHATASVASPQAASEPVHGPPLVQTTADEAYTYYDDPHAKTSSKGHSHLEASAISYWQAKQRVGTGRRAVKSHPWDIKKRVTSIYGDAFQQL